MNFLLNFGFLFGNYLVVYADSGIFIGADGKNHSSYEWLFTTEPGTYGLIAGTSSIIGWPLLLIVIIISLCSMPCVRKRGYFEVKKKSIIQCLYIFNLSNENWSRFFTGHTCCAYPSGFCSSSTCNTFGNGSSFPASFT